MSLDEWSHWLGTIFAASADIVDADNAALLEQIIQTLSARFQALVAALFGWVEPLVARPLLVAALTLLACVALFGLYAVLGEQNELDEETENLDAGLDAGDANPDDLEITESSSPSLDESDDGELAEDYWELFDRADQLRREGQGLKAAKLYERALRACRQSDESSQYGLPVEPVRDYARMLYHMGVAQRSVQVIDEYTEFERKNGRKPDGPLVGLRKRLARGDMRQLEEKYGVAPEATGEFTLPQFIRRELAEQASTRDSEPDDEES